MVFLGRIHRTIATLALIAVLTPLVTTAETPAEIKLKGAFLYNFTKFVKWPDNAYPRVNVAAITLVPDSNRIRFCISTKAADKSGVEISSKLLSLAISVER